MKARTDLTRCVILAAGLITTTSGGSAVAGPWAQVLGQSSYWYIHSVRQVRDGGHVLAGYTESRGTGNRDAWCVRMNSAGSVLWQRTYGGTGFESTTAIIETEDSGFLLAGSKAAGGSLDVDLWLLRLNEDGNILWQKTFGGTQTDRAHSLQATRDGGYVVAGWSRSLGAGGIDAWCLKVDATGAATWQETYGGAGDDVVYDVVQTNDAGFILAGKTKSRGSGGSDGWLLKLESDGTEQWQKPFGGTGDDVFYSLDDALDGGYVACGIYSSSKYVGGDAAWVVCVDGSGRIRWERRLDEYGHGDAAFSIVRTRDGGFAVAGTDGVSGVVYRLNHSGGTRWRVTFSNNYSIKSVAFDLQETTDRGFIVVGGVGYLGTETYLRAWGERLDKAGRTAWQWEWGPDGRSRFLAASPTRDGGCILAGDTNISGAGDKDGWLVRMSARGKILWQRTYGGREDDSIVAVIEAGDGRLLAVGNKEQVDGYFQDAWILEVDANGKVMSDRRFGTSRMDTILSFRQTKDGGHILAGYTDYPSGVSDAWVVKLDVELTIEWQRRYGMADVTEWAADVVELPDGGYVVAGALVGELGGGLWIVRVEEDGDMVWQRTYGPGAGEGTAITAAEGGGLVVAHSGGLLKIDQDGSVLWNKNITTSNGYPIVLDLLSTTDGSQLLTGSFSDSDGWYATVDSSGGISGDQRIHSKTTDYVFGACQLTDGSFVLAGEAWDENTQTVRGLVLRTGADGSLCGGLGRATGAAMTDAHTLPSSTSAVALAMTARMRAADSQESPSVTIADDLCASSSD